jgi:hypothetical protein
MLMFYFSSEHAEVERVRKELIEAGIPCEIHEMAPMKNTPPEDRLPAPSEEELWLQNEADSHRALMICVALGVGFAKREVPPELLAFSEDSEPEGNGQENGDGSNGTGAEKRWGGPTAGWRSASGYASDAA